ncbi:hypothetical protein AG1IA_09965 [Rhizoctonia solani AG-1 IA]|uniref:Uncharacterized protein n=1 Tax=Thanatephorus cucumeris (strain AG1-IA) TaxID=983506 RepID=L8WDG6_THACA|nr:hypothetical protein AG1IA_09965 [Rhizoctonia solani AG-1 IA]
MTRMELLFSQHERLQGYWQTCGNSWATNPIIIKTILRLVPAREGVSRNCRDLHKGPGRDEFFGPRPFIVAALYLYHRSLTSRSYLIHFRALAIPQSEEHHDKEHAVPQFLPCWQQRNA